MTRREQVDFFGTESEKAVLLEQFAAPLFFGSEIKALMRHPLFGRDIDLESLNKYLSCDYILRPAFGKIPTNWSRLLIWCGRMERR